MGCAHGRRLADNQGTFDRWGDWTEQDQFKMTHQVAIENSYSSEHGRYIPGELNFGVSSADMFLWPGVGEAYGMVYLEAQAQGCPVLAEDRPGVRDVVRDGGWLVAPEDPPAFAMAIETLMNDDKARLAAGRRARRQIAADHLLDAARTSLKTGLGPLIGRRGH